jgi:23S rRNA (uracil1939-C5)-methyltransferase
MGNRSNSKKWHQATVTIESWAGEGHGLGRLPDGRVVFVPWTLPGDVAEVVYRNTSKSYIRAHLKELVTHSSQRRQAACRHFGYCGGCQLQHAPYYAQLALKHQHIQGLMQHLGRFKAPPVEEVLPCPSEWAYRNKLDFAFASRGWLSPEQLKQPEIKKEAACGFHVAGHFDKVISIEECLLQPDDNNSIRKALVKLALSEGMSFFDPRSGVGVLRSLVLRCNRNNEWMVLLVVNGGGVADAIRLFETLQPQFPQIISWYYVENPKKNDSLHDLEPVLWKGQPWLEETLDGLRFRVHPKSFFQTNTLQAEQLYKLAREMAQPGPEDVLFDLYCGTGTTTAVIGRYARLAVGVDVVEEAIADARRSAEENGLTHLRFECGDTGALLAGGRMQAYGQPDILITDPPRAGMTPEVCREIQALAPRRIVYISCNPATMVRDLNMLSEKYDVQRIKPVDMFPQTRHIECVTLLTLKPSEQEA